MNQTITLNINVEKTPLLALASILLLPPQERGRLRDVWDYIMLMAKRVNPDVLDLTLNGFKTGSGTTGPANLMTVCSAEPTTFTEGNATFKLADVAMASGDFTLANGDGGGNTPRKVTMGAKSTVPVDTTGTATHVALLDTANSKLMEVTTCTSQGLTSGNTVNFPAWKIEIGAPT